MSQQTLNVADDAALFTGITADTILEALKAGFGVRTVEEVFQWCFCNGEMPKFSASEDGRAERDTIRRHVCQYDDKKVLPSYVYRAFSHLKK